MREWKCGICADARCKPIDALLAEGRTSTYIEEQMKVAGTPAKRETVAKHLKVCLSGNPLNSRSVRGQMDTDDFAELVQAEAVRLMKGGTLKVRTQDGLSAQTLLDRRKEKAADRDLLLNLARLMSGSRALAPSEVIVEEIEGTFHEVGLAPTDLVVVE